MSKPLPQRAPTTTRRELLQERINNRVREAFLRLPLLLGFSLDTDLAIGDIEVHACPGCEGSVNVYRAIDAEITALVEELAREAALELLRGRTFARTLH